MYCDNEIFPVAVSYDDDKKVTWKNIHEIVSNLNEDYHDEFLDVIECATFLRHDK